MGIPTRTGEEAEPSETLPRGRDQSGWAHKRLPIFRRGRWSRFPELDWRRAFFCSSAASFGLRAPLALLSLMRRWAHARPLGRRRGTGATTAGATQVVWRAQRSRAPLLVASRRGRGRFNSGCSRLARGAPSIVPTGRSGEGGVAARSPSQPTTRLVVHT